MLALIVPFDVFQNSVGKDLVVGFCFSNAFNFILLCSEEDTFELELFLDPHQVGFVWVAVVC